MVTRQRKTDHVNVVIVAEIITYHTASDEQILVRLYYLFILKQALLSQCSYFRKSVTNRWSTSKAGSEVSPLKRAADDLFTIASCWNRVLNIGRSGASCVT